MPIIPWSPTLDVGVPEIDHQHKLLVTRLNCLHKAIAAGHAPARINELIRQLEHYTEYHFATEERLMAEHGYEFTDFHCADHRAMSLQIREFVGDLEQNFATHQGVLNFLEGWLLDHITGADRHLGAALRDGVRPAVRAHADHAAGHCHPA